MNPDLQYQGWNEVKLLNKIEYPCHRSECNLHQAESEKNVQEALNNLMKQRTSVIIAHRLSTIQHADQIIVLDKGIIAEQGTYAELMNKMGLFRKLVDMQTFETSPESS